MVNALSRPVDRDKAHAAVALIRAGDDFDLVEASSALFQAGLDLHRDRPDKEWSLTDCISFIVMENQGITQALAYDYHFEQAAFEALLRRDPP